MKNNAIFFLTITLWFCCSPSIAQDTIRTKMPYWHYNYYDSTWCQMLENNGFEYTRIVLSSAINKCGERNSPGSYNVPVRQENGFALCRYFDESPEVAIRMDMDSAGEIKGLAFGYDVYNNYFFCNSNYGHYLYNVITDIKYPFMGMCEPRYYTDDYIFNIYDEWMNLIWSDTVATSNLGIDYYMKIGFNYDTLGDLWVTNSVLQTWASSGREAPTYIGLCKVDFDTVISVPQTFYIGITSSTPINTQQDTMCVIAALFELYHSADYDTLCTLPYESRRYRVSNNVGEQIQNWAEEECHYGVQTCLYPILSLPCHDVDGLQYEPLGSAGTIAYVSWDGDPSHSSYELSYGPRGTQPGEGTVVQPSATHWVISPLDRNAHYDVYVRARCDLDTIKWSAWSDPLHVHIASYGIDEAEAPEVTLSPNPTTGKLTIGCEAEIKEVEMYDLQGRMVSGKWKEGSGKCAVLDLAGLPAGSYILVAHTTKGVATRTVEKR